jgi:hypothetical protein
MPLSDEIKMALASTEESSTRARRIAFFMQVAVILTCMAVWQQMEGTWLNRRLVVAQAAKFLLDCEQEGTPSDQCKESLKKSFSSRETWLRPAFLFKPEPPTPEQVEAYVDQWHLTSEQAGKNVENLQQAMANRVLAIGIPVLGISVDLNDLSVLSGFSFIILLSWFNFSLRRYRDNVYDLFRRTTDRERASLPDVYDLLRMTQVLTVPEPRIHNDTQSTKKSDPKSRYFRVKNALVSFRKRTLTVTNFILLSSLGAQLIALVVDLGTTDAGNHLNRTLTRFENSLAVLLTLYVFARTLHCYSILNDARKHWTSALEEAQKPLPNGANHPTFDREQIQVELSLPENSNNEPVIKR